MLAEVEELRKLKPESKKSNKEFARRIEENKKKLGERIAQSPITVKTRKIIHSKTSYCIVLYRKSLN